MTDQRDLKRRIRARMAKTGESYTTARTHVLAQRDEPEAPPPFDVVLPIDLTEAAEPLGFKCRVLMFPQLAERVTATAALTRLRDALLATEDDFALRQLRASAFRGELPRGRTWKMLESHEDIVRFVCRAQAGLGGISAGGTMLALNVGTEMVLFTLSTHRTTRETDPVPVIWMHSVSESVGTVKVAGLIMR